jgi:hypothetical protein
MKKILFVLVMVFVSGMADGQSTCTIPVAITLPQDSCPGSPQTFITSVSGGSGSMQVCASDVPSAIAQAGDTVTAHVYSPCGCMTNPMTINSVQSVSYRLAGNVDPCGADIAMWLQSPAGTFLLMQDVRPFNDGQNTCFCPTFTNAGTDGLIPNSDGPYNSTNYMPEGGLLSSFTGENPCTIGGEWTLYMIKSDNNCGDSTWIDEFCISFTIYSSTSNLTYTWSSDSANCLAYLSDTTIANPVFTPPSGMYDCTYYLNVYDSTCNCSGTDTFHVSCPSSVSVSAIDNSVSKFQVSLFNSEITFSYDALAEEKEVVLHDLAGKETARYILPRGSSSHTESASTISKGVYVATFSGTGRNVKFVLQ